MIKANDFWKFMCDDMEYRLFSGVPCLEFKPFYDSMSPKFMHYVPAVDEHTAFGICTGAAVAGVNTGILIDCEYLDLIEDWLKFCLQYKIHLLVITNSDVSNSAYRIKFSGDYGNLKKLLIAKRKQDKPVVIVVEEVN